MIHAVGFDLDDTLLDHRGAANDGITALFAAHGWSMNHGYDLVVEWERIERVTFVRYRVGELTLVEQRRERMREILALAEILVSDGELIGLFHEFLDRYADAWCTFADVIPALDTLRDAGFRLAVLTNGQQMQQEAKLVRLGIADRFESILGIEKMTAAKPDPRAFQDLCSALDLGPAEVAYVGDDVAADAIAASAVGLHGVWLNRHTETADAIARIQIGSLAVLPSVIRNLA